MNQKLTEPTKREIEMTRKTVEPIYEEELWEKFSELVETIRCDSRGDEPLMTRKQFELALEHFANTAIPEPNPVPPVGDPRNAFTVEIVIHTDDARKYLDSPETVRHRIGFGIEANSELEEEIDYTLAVSRSVAAPPAPSGDYQYKALYEKKAIQLAGMVNAGHSWSIDKLARLLSTEDKLAAPPAPSVSADAELKMNINEAILVTLTAAGEAAWKKHWSITSPEGVPDSIRMGQTEPDCRVRFQLWEAMHIFGSDCFNGSNRLPFLNNVISIPRESAAVPEPLASPSVSMASQKICEMCKEKGIRWCDKAWMCQACIDDYFAGRS
jgi:hypothetical protein